MKKIRAVALLAAAILLLTGCGGGSITPAPGTEENTGKVSTITEETDMPEDKYAGYNIISIEDYTDKTTAGFVAQLVGFLSGYEFAKDGKGKCRVALPETLFQMCRGPYAVTSTVVKHTSKLIRNKETGLWEVWNDDDYNIDILNQYILRDMYKKDGALSPKYIRDGWVNYEVYDMGGGQHQVGAYALFKRNSFLPQFAGNTEYGNWYSYCTEPFLGTDTLGMDAAGMPETAREISEMLAQTTGDRENVEWSQMFAVMNSLAYFESDIPTIIRKAAAVFPDGAWELEVIDTVFKLHEKYPDNWKDAYKEFEKINYVEDYTRETDDTINCGFALLDLLYGEGDYTKTCKYGSLAGYDCESTCGMALTVVGIIDGMKNLPEEANEYVWQDGRGVVINEDISTIPEGNWMSCKKLPREMPIKDIVDLYRQNFEQILLEKGGLIENGNYYIPKQDLLRYEAVGIANQDFETGTLEGWKTEGDITVCKMSTYGLYALQLKGSGEIRQTVTGLEKGSSYKLKAYICTPGNGSAYLFAGKNCAGVIKTVGTPKYDAHATVMRELIFTADSESMDIGVMFSDCADKSYLDSFSLLKLDLTETGSAKSAETLPLISNTSHPAEFSLEVEKAGLYYIKMDYGYEYPMSTATVSINSRNYAAIGLHRTAEAPEGYVCGDYLIFPVMLKAGSNTVKIQPAAGRLTVKEVSLTDLGIRK